MQVFVGLKFTSATFRMTAEIKEVRQAANQVDVLLTSSEGDAWIEKDWNLEHVKWAFERGDYKPVDRNQVEISIY